MSDKKVTEQSHCSIKCEPQPCRSFFWEDLFPVEYVYTRHVVRQCYLAMGSER